MSSLPTQFDAYIKTKDISHGIDTNVRTDDSYCAQMWIKPLANCNHKGITDGIPHLLSSMICNGHVAREAKGQTLPWPLRFIVIIQTFMDF